MVFVAAESGKTFRTLAAILLLASSLPAQQVSGVRRFSQVNDHLYRGAQPTAEGLHALFKLGVTTILDLRPGGGRGIAEEREAKALGMHYSNVPMNALHAPTKDEIDQAIAVLQDPKNWPVFVHCQHGVDRTGTVIACYRIKVDAWPNDRAEKEAEERGMHRVEYGMKSFILNFHPPGSKPSSPIDTIRSGK